MPKVLHLEPDTIYAANVRRYLIKKGYEVQRQAEAQSAIHAVESFSPHIIVTELLLANHNGIEFLYELRSYADWQSIPVVILTNAPSPEIDGAGFSLRMNVAHYLYKPDTPLTVLAKALKRSLVATA